jgi:uncharacterized protein (DUF362 family)
MGTLLLSGWGLQEYAKAGDAPSPARKGRPNPFVENGLPILVVVEGKEPGKMLEAALDALGGLKKLLKGGEDIVLKPNFISDQPPPVTTDVDFALLIGEFFRRAGSGDISLCDSSGFSNFGKDYTRVFEYNKSFQKGKASGVKIVPSDGGARDRYKPVQKESWEVNPTILLDRYLLNSTILVNVPVLKKHDTARLSCALKNHFGAVYTPQRHEIHKKIEQEKNGMNIFLKTVAEFADAVRPELTVVDARSLLIKGGPLLRGRAEIKQGIDRIILSGDMLAVDAYCAGLLEEHDQTFSQDMIHVSLDHAQKLGLGIRDLGKVKLVELTV